MLKPISLASSGNDVSPDVQAGSGTRNMPSASRLLFA